MEVFRRIFEQTLHHERNKAAIFTRKQCKKTIGRLEETVSNLTSKLEEKDSNTAKLQCAIDELKSQLESKKSNIVRLEKDLKTSRKTLEGKSHQIVSLELELNTQKEKFAQQFAPVAQQNTELSANIWTLVEENCFMNKRILDLELEIHNLEQNLNNTQNTLKEAESRCTSLNESFKMACNNWDNTSQQYVQLSMRERQLQATVFNLSSELAALKHITEECDKPCERRHDDSNATSDSRMASEEEPVFTSRISPNCDIVSMYEQKVSALVKMLQHIVPCPARPPIVNLAMQSLSLVNLSPPDFHAAIDTVNGSIQQIHYGMLAMMNLAQQFQDQHYEQRQEHYDQQQDPEHHQDQHYEQRQEHYDQRQYQHYEQQQEQRDHQSIDTPPSEPLPT